MTCERGRRTALSGAALGALALAFACVGACSTHQDGTSIEVLVKSTSAGQQAVRARPQVLTTDRGYRVTLDHVYVVLGRVELIPCRQARLWPGLRALLGPSVARAHGVSTPTVWAVPHVLDLLDARDRDLSVARMRPPAGRYCAARMLIDVADADAEALPEDVPMVGRSIHVDGSFSAPDESTTHPFRYQTAINAPVDLTFVDPRGAPMKLELSSAHLRAELRMELGFATLLDGVTMVRGDYEPHAVHVLDNVLAHARAVLVDD